MEIDFNFLKKYKKIIFLIALVAAVVSIIAAFSAPQFYKIKIKIHFDWSSNTKNAKILFNIIKSQKILDAVVRDVDLKSVFNVNSEEKARDRLSSILYTVYDFRNNAIDIVIKWEYADQIAVIANSLIKELQLNYPDPFESVAIESRIMEYNNYFNSVLEKLEINKIKENEILENDKEILDIIKQIAIARAEISESEELLINSSATSTVYRLAILDNIKNSQNIVNKLQFQVDEYVKNSPPSKRVERYVYLGDRERIETEFNIYKNFLNREKIKKVVVLNWQILEITEPIKENMTVYRFNILILTFLIILITTLFILFIIEASFGLREER